VLRPKTERNRRNWREAGLSGFVILVSVSWVSHRQVDDVGGGVGGDNTISEAFVEKTEEVAEWLCGFCDVGGGVAEWRNGGVAVWRCHFKALWQRSRVALWLCGGVALWQSGRLAEWRSGFKAL